MKKNKLESLAVKSFVMDFENRDINHLMGGKSRRCKTVEVKDCFDDKKTQPPVCQVA